MDEIRKRKIDEYLTAHAEKQTMENTEEIASKDRAVQDYNIMMGVLLDPEEEENDE